MSNQASKKRKLSLKKPNGAKQPDQKNNTIISMFQKHNDKQLVEEQIKESGSEGDVVITNVIGLNADACQSLSKSASTSEALKKNQSNDSTKRLSLSDKKRRKITDTKDCESASDSDFEVTKPKTKEKRKFLLSKSLSAQETRPQGGHYSLRKRNIVPVVEVSYTDLDDDEKAKSESVNENSSRVTCNVKSKEKIDNIEKEKERDDCSIEDVIVIPPSEAESKYFGKSEKRKLSTSSEKLKLSLKKSRSGKESQHEIVKAKSKESLRIKSVIVNIECDTGKLSSDINGIAEKKISKDTPTKTGCRLSNENPSDQESSSYLNYNKKKHYVDSKEINVNSVLMQKAGGTNNEDSDRSDSSKSDKDRHNFQHKMVSMNNKPISKLSVKSKKGLAVNETAEINNVDSDTVIDGNDDDADEEADDDDDIKENDEKVEYRVPYYLENFKKILESVLEDKENARLFDEVDMKYITIFNNLEEGSQMLYVRLFSRKLTWLPISKVNYPEISDNIPELIDGLTETGFLHSESELSDLPIVLKILSAPDLKTLAKSFHINSQGMTKASIIEELLKKGKKNSISAMFKGGSTGTMEKTVLKRARSYLGKVCRLTDEPRAVFIRLLMLFSLYNTNFDEESGGGGQNQLFQMLMVNIGRVVYPSYTVNRDRSVFQDRAALIRFETALQFEIDIQGFTERNKWAQAYDVYKQAREVGRLVCKNKQYMNWDRGLPQFLRLYTAGSVYTRIDNQGVEILQRLKQYKEAVHLLEELLAQDLYCVQYRGHWYERLALNLEAHLKSVKKSFDVLMRGLSDSTVRTGRRLALYERARKICEAPKSKYADRISEFDHQEVLPTPEVHIEGMVVSDATAVGMKYKFVMQGDSDSVTFCGVEELVLEHYKQNGYPEGLHAEGSIVSNLFVLLFWDIMFMDVPNVFHGPFQSCPLDIATQDFYLNRQQVIDERSEWIKNASVEELTTEVARIWSEHEGEMCSGISWDKFSGPDTQQNLVSCMGGPIIAGILERYVKDPRHTRSGFPDLTLWNTDTKQFKICEVKGPNDRLSYKQILWIDYLQKLGIDAEVCYVKAVGSKKLKPVVKN